MAMTPILQQMKPDEGHPLILNSFGEARFHTDGDLLALAYAADGTLCSIEEPGVLRRWDAQGRPIDRHFLHDLETLWVFSPGAKWVVAACDDLLIWDVASQKLVAKLAQPSWVTAVAFTPDRSHIATGHDDGIVRLWKAGDNQPVTEFAEHDLPVSALAFDSNGTRLASAGEDRLIKIWDVATNTLLKTLTGHTDRIPGVAWHPNGEQLVSVGWDTTARVWDVNTGEPKILLNNHDDQVEIVAFSPDGKQLATSDSASTVHIWGDLLAAEALHRLPGYAEELRALAFRPDGKRLALGGTDRVIHIYDTESGQLVGGGGMGVRRAVTLWNQPRPRIAINAEDGLRVWELDSGSELPSPLPAGRYLHIAASPDGRWIAGVTPDALIHLWDEQTRTHHAMDGSKSAPNYLTFSHDSTMLLAAVGNEGTAWLWNIEQMEPALLVVEAAEGCSVESIALHPNGQWLLCGGIDFMSTSGSTGNVCLWDLPTKKRRHTIAQGATCLAFEPSGQRYAFATPDGSIVVVDSVSGEVLLEIDGRDGEHFHALKFCPEGAWLIGAASDATLRVWDTATGVQLSSRQFAVPIHSLAIDNDGRLFAGSENTICHELALSRLNELS